MAVTFREELYRSRHGIERLGQARVTVCGAGALGANLLESLARSGLRNLKVIDFDRIEERNLSTQPYHLDDVGAKKASVLAHIIYQAVGVQVGGVTETLTDGNVAKLLAQSDLVIDCFDNSLARRTVAHYCAKVDMPCLHAGLANGFAEVMWNDVYRIPSASQDNICDYPLARNLVTLAVAVASETVIRSLLSGERRNWTVTLEDLTIAPYT